MNMVTTQVQSEARQRMLWSLVWSPKIIKNGKPLTMCTKTQNVNKKIETPFLFEVLLRKRAGPWKFWFFFLPLCVFPLWFRVVGWVCHLQWRCPHGLSIPRWTAFRFWHGKWRVNRSQKCSFLLSFTFPFLLPGHPHQSASWCGHPYPRHLHLPCAQSCLSLLIFLSTIFLNTGFLLFFLLLFLFLLPSSSSSSSSLSASSSPFSSWAFPSAYMSLPFSRCTTSFLSC